MTEAKLERRFRPAGRDMHSLYAGYYVAELLLNLTDEYDPHPELFDVADWALRSLTDGASVFPVVLRFELLALRLLGHLPNLETCVECGEPVLAEGRIAFGQLAGGVVCANCRPGKKQIVSIGAGVLSILRCFANLDSEDWQTVTLAGSVRGETRGVISHYISHLLGRKPKMYSYLGFLATNS